MKQLLCLLFGHSDTRLEWSDWYETRYAPRYRLLIDTCVRCHHEVVLARYVEPLA